MVRRAPSNQTISPIPTNRCCSHSSDQPGSFKNWLYCNYYLLASTPANLTDKLQSVMNASARIVCGLKKYDLVQSTTSHATCETRYTGYAFRNGWRPELWMTWNKIVLTRISLKDSFKSVLHKYVTVHENLSRLGDIRNLYLLNNNNNNEFNARFIFR